MAGTQSPSLNAPFTPDAAVFCKPGECQKLWTALQNGGKQREFGNWFQQSTQKLSEKVLNGNLSGKDVTVFVNYMCLSGKIVRAVSKASKDVNVQVSAAYSFAVDTERENGSDELAVGCSYPGKPFPCGIMEANLLSDVMANNHLLTERDAFIRIQEKSVTRGQCFVSATQRRRAHAKRNEHAPNIDNFSDRFSARSQSSVVVNRGDSTATRRCLTAKRTRSDDRVESEMELHSTESRDVEGLKETILNGHDFYERVKRIKQETGLEADLQDSEAHYMVVTEGNEGRPEEDDGETSSLEDDQAMDGSESCLSETDAFMHTASVNHSANDSEEMGANSSGGEDNFSGRDVTPETSGMGQCDLNTEADFTESAGPSPLSATMKTPEGAVEDDVEPPSPNPANDEMLESYEKALLMEMNQLVQRQEESRDPEAFKGLNSTSEKQKKKVDHQKGNTSRHLSMDQDGTDKTNSMEDQSQELSKEHQSSVLASREQLQEQSPTTLNNSPVRGPVDGNVRPSPTVVTPCCSNEAIVGKLNALLECINKIVSRPGVQQTRDNQPTPESTDVIPAIGQAIESTKQALVDDGPKYLTEEVLFNEYRKSDGQKRRFAARLNRLLFTEEERKRSNVSGTKGKDKLNENIINYIQRQVFRFYPSSSAEKITEWIVCIKSIDETNRALNKKYMNGPVDANMAPSNRSYIPVQQARNNQPTAGRTNIIPTIRQATHSTQQESVDDGHKYLTEEVLFNEYRKSGSQKRRFAARLNRLLFTEEERRRSNVTGKRGKDKLNENVINYIKHQVFRFYPSSSAEKMAEWMVCIKSIDETNRALNKKLR